MCVCLGSTVGFLFYQKFSLCVKGTRLSGIPSSPPSISPRVDSLLPLHRRSDTIRKSRQHGASLTLIKTNQAFFKNLSVAKTLKLDCDLKMVHTPKKTSLKRLHFICCRLMFRNRCARVPSVKVNSKSLCPMCQAHLAEKRASRCAVWSQVPAGCMTQL